MSESIGDRIRKVRKALNLTQRKLAEQLGISQQHISHIEKGTKEASEMLIKYFCLLYNTSEEWLTTGEGKMFLSPEEIIKMQIDRIGEKAYFEALSNIISKSDPAIWTPAAETTTGSPDLDDMISFLIKLWQIPDEDMKAWARVQFARAFPSDIEKEIEKKRTEALALPTLIQKYMSKDFNKNDL